MTANPLRQTLLNSLNTYHRLLHAKRIWLACSGGRDSLSLAKLCCDLYDTGELPFLPQLLHVNHGMQDANDAWAKQVQAWAHQHDMKCKLLPVTLSDHSEQSARLARYHALQSVMNCDDVLMLGHHSDDQVETVLMRLFNGTGVKGLGGMRAWTARQYGNKMVYLWRPWLSISRAQITQYARLSGLNYIDDPTNVAKNKPPSLQADSHDNTQSSINDRAWLRGVLMPVIHERYPQASVAIARSSQLMQEANAIIEVQVQADLLSVIEPNTHSQLPSTLQSIMAIDKLLRLPSARQAALIHHWLSPSRGELPPSQRLVNDVLALCQRDNPNHQTCLYWNNSQQHYEIRRYKNRLYRLHSDWVAWLQLPAIKQQISLTAQRHPHSVTIVDIKASDAKTMDVMSDAKHDVKQKNTKFRWQLHLPMRLMAHLLKQAQSSKHRHDTSLQANDWVLSLEPLPRDIKLGLAGRVGRKSGKKLLQAIDQPAFMRTSIALLCIRHGAAEHSDAVIPLLIVTVTGVLVVQSAYTDISLALVASGQLTTTVLLTD